MYLLRLFLLGWFTVGTVTVVFLYWLCSCTAATNKIRHAKLAATSTIPRDDPSQEVRAA
jgi:hypothetical protein